MRQMLAFGAICATLLSGCAAQTEQPQAQPAMQPVPQADPAGALLGEEDARIQVLAPLAGAGEAMLTEETLSIREADGQSHAYFVFAVSNAEGKDVGKAAVDRTTGQVYYYLGDGVLEEYTSFPLYDPEKAVQQSWTGLYADGEGRTLTIAQQQEGGLEYAFSDGTKGEAVLQGNTARSSDGTLHFLLEQEIITVAGDDHAGNYRLRPDS
nr:hypothetical protein [uncultured Agathobaculum sp.]